MAPPPLAELTARAQTLSSAGDLVGARRVLATALDPADAADPRHANADLALAAALHARILIALGDPHGARTWAAFAHAAEERLHGPRHERTMSAAATHAAVLQRVGHYGKAAQVYKRLVADLAALDGPDSQRVLAAEADLATAEHAAGNCTAARNRLADAWVRHRRMYGDASAAGIKMLARLGAMERECARDLESREHLALAQELCARYLPADHPLVRQVATLAVAPATGRHVCGRVAQSTGPIEAGPQPPAPQQPWTAPPPAAPQQPWTAPPPAAPHQTVPQQLGPNQPGPQQTWPPEEEPPPETHRAEPQPARPGRAEPQEAEPTARTWSDGPGEPATEPQDAEPQQLAPTVNPNPPQPEPRQADEAPAEPRRPEAEPEQDDQVWADEFEPDAQPPWHEDPELHPARMPDDGPPPIWPEAPDQPAEPELRPARPPEAGPQPIWPPQQAPRPVRPPETDPRPARPAPQAPPSATGSPRAPMPTTPPRSVPFPRRPTVPDPDDPDSFPPDLDDQPPADNRPTDPNGNVYQQPLYLSDVHRAPGDLTGRHARADTPPPLPGRRAPEYGPDGRPQPVGTAPTGTLATPPNSERRLPVRTAEPPPVTRRRQPFLLVAVLIAGIAVAAVVVALTLPRANGGVGPAPAGTTAAPPAATQASAAPTPSATGAPGAPTNLKLKDNRDSVHLTWTYPKDAEGPILISGGRQGQQLKAFQQLAAGTSDYMVYGLNDTQNYCFTVAVAYSADRIAASAPVCTQR